MAESAFVIDGDEYPIPGLETFNMNEAVTLYEHSGLSLEDFAIDDDNPEQVEELQIKTKNPGFIFALMLVAYQRGNKGVNKRKAESVIADSNIISAYEAFVRAGMDEDPTPTQESEPTEESSPGSGSVSGEHSQTSLVQPEDAQNLTGTSA